MVIKPKDGIMILIHEMLWASLHTALVCHCPLGLSGRGVCFRGDEVVVPLKQLSHLIQRGDDERGNHLPFQLGSCNGAVIRRTRRYTCCVIALDLRPAHRPLALGVEQYGNGAGPVAAHDVILGRIPDHDDLGRVHTPFRADVQQRVRRGFVGFKVARKGRREWGQRPRGSVKMRNGRLHVARHQPTRDPSSVEKRTQRFRTWHRLHGGTRLLLHLVYHLVRPLPPVLGPPVDLAQDVFG
mmetsp:Transcript_10035/g.24699  ORF Transcript_10035/g.24699 Transcript_10035/m.24699 type:complete len:240 (+) Transcript_10035:2724-3443(+)